MARYIDADALLKKIFPFEGVDKKTYPINAKAVYDAICAMPTADVVPKSECDRCAERKQKFIGGLQEQIANTKAEVAREIFDEIQKMVNRYWLDNDYGMPDMETELTKLKKKYTEDQT